MSTKTYGAWVAVLVAASVAVAAVARVASTPRAALLFRDGDSMLPLLVMRSVDAGQPQDWAMSSVLFLPELLMFAGVWMLRLGADATILICAIVNLFALFLALRVAAGSAAKARMPWAGTLLAFLAFAFLVGLDHTASRDSVEWASLLVTTTYYSATVIATILAIGLLRRAAEPVGRPVAAVLGLALIAAASVLTNPLFLLWGTAPLALVAVIAAIADHRVGAAVTERPGPTLVWAAASLIAASAVGYVLRIPLARFIANDGLSYIDPGAAGYSLGYHLALVAEQWTTPTGALSGVVTLGALGLAVWGSIRLRGTAAGLVATAGWAIPVIVVVTAMALGTDAARYLQPVVFAPLAALVLVPALFPRAAEATASVVRRHRVAVAVVAVAVILVPGAVAVPALAAPRADPDLECVTAWVDDSERTGAGQYWTVRLPKSRVADPRTLVQVDDRLRPYEWLVNRDDSAVASVSFLVSDAESTPWAIPADVLASAERIECGRYTITDFGDRELRLGIPRS